MHRGTDNLASKSTQSYGPSQTCELAEKKLDYPAWRLLRIGLCFPCTRCPQYLGSHLSASPHLWWSSTVLYLAHHGIYLGMTLPEYEDCLNPWHRAAAESRNQFPRMIPGHPVNLFMRNISSDSTHSPMPKLTLNVALHNFLHQNHFIYDLYLSTRCASAQLLQRPVGLLASSSSTQSSRLRTPDHHKSSLRNPPWSPRMIPHHFTWYPSFLFIGN